MTTRIPSGVDGPHPATSLPSLFSSRVSSPCRITQKLHCSSFLESDNNTTQLLGGKYMKPPPTLFKHSLTLKSSQQAFSFNNPLYHGRKFSCKIRFMFSGVIQRPQSNDTQTTKPSFLISILRNSILSRSLPMGKMAHTCIYKSGFVRDLLVANNLLHMYCSRSLIFDALKLFNEMPERDVVSWNTVVSGFVEMGYFQDGFFFYCEMRRVGLWPSQSSFASVLVASVEIGSFESYKQIHGESLKFGFSDDLLVGNALLTAYVKSGVIENSIKIFDGMRDYDHVSIEILLRVYVRHGISVHDAFYLFIFSLVSKVTLSCFALSSLLSLCAETVIDHGLQIQGYVIKVGLSTDVSIVNSLISMYARSHHLEEAVYLFDETTAHDIVTWNSLIAGCAFNGEGDLGLGYVARFLSTGMRMNKSTFSSFLSSCAAVTVLENARRAHALIMKSRESGDIRTDNIILTMYCKCRNASYANIVFNTIDERDDISYNLMLGLFKNLGWYEEAIGVFHLIQLDGFKVDGSVYSSVISSCSCLVNLEVGRQIHGCIVKTGFDLIPPLGNSLLEMYSQCGRLEDMVRCFSEIGTPDVFSWNTMIMSYTNVGLFNQSIAIWEEMKISGVEFNRFSYCAMIDICSYIVVPLMGEQIHARIKKSGLAFDTALMNSLLTMYASCRMMEKASAIFEEIISNDSVSWNAMVCGYAQNGFIEDSLRFYLRMQRCGYTPTNMTFASISKSCGDCLELLLGLQFHAEVVKRGFESDVIASNSFITMYAKCGNIHDSSRIFLNPMISRDVITWNSMICAYAQHGCAREALDTFEEMKTRGAKPNVVTFIGILSACDHAGLITEASALFGSMYQEHGIAPSEEHYACMVDILCRAGRPREAKGLIDNMPYEPCSLIWRTLLSGCRNNENIELGEEAAQKLLQRQPNDSSAYVLLSNIYASAEKMEEKAEMRRRMGDRSVKKDIGYSWVQS